jgi:hypothetical protein
MKAAASLIAKLRASKVSIRSEGGRLIVEAPSGVITAEVRAELAKRKSELLAALEAEIPEQDSALTHAQNEVAGLLAVAYKRYIAIPNVGAGRNTNSGDAALAKSPGQSVHGVVP